MKNELEFSDYPISGRPYAGAGKKLSVVIDGEPYMVKLSERIRNKAKDTSYANSCFSEYIGSHIVNSMGLPAQETYLGTYEGKIAVACKDFVPNGSFLGSFSDLQNKIPSIHTHKKETKLESTLAYIEKQTIIPPEELKKHFWKQFIVDALIANTDRHGGNWGYLYNEVNNTYSISPIYDCGAGLFPLLSERQMESYLTKGDTINQLIKNEPSSVFTYNGVKVNYYQTLVNNSRSELPFKDDLSIAIKELSPNINSKKIAKIINETPYLSETQKNFYKKVTSLRNELMIQRAYKREIKFDKEKGIKL